MTEVDFRINSKKGRKPKGAKITLNQIDNVNSAIHVSNIILHLKCTSSEIAIYKNLRIYTPKSESESESESKAEFESESESESETESVHETKRKSPFGPKLSTETELSYLRQTDNIAVSR